VRRTFEGDAPYECTDGADNDQDGAADCADDSCAADLACLGADDDDSTETDDDDSEATDDDDSAGADDDDDSSPVDPSEIDDDGDGQSEADGDCDDADPNNYSGNAEACDGEDNDCDGEAGPDEVDLDSDGSLACDDCDDTNGSLEELDADGDGFSTCAGDCDDSEVTVYVGAPEVWDDGLDNDCDGMPDASNPNCFANFSLDFPDGSTATFDGCVVWSLDATYEYDPNEPPEVNSLTLEFNATASPGFECQVLIVQEELCGTGYYDAADLAQTITYTTFDCSGVGNTFEDVYTAAVGYVNFHVVSAGQTAGNFTGIPLTTTIGGALSVEDDSGVQLSGNFAVSVEQVADDSEQQFTCAGSDGDEDGDGEVDVYYGGTDCDDQDPANFAGNLEVCDGQDNDCNGLADFYVPPTTGDDDDSAGDDDDSAGDDDDSAGDDDDSAGSGLGYDSSELDLDGDGYLECADDCDDLDSAFSPVAPELCDGEDNDCDTVLPTDEEDFDADGQMGCEGDCDDFDAANFLGNSEVCDGQDNDCNGLDDAGNPGVGGEETDDDLDGFPECGGDCDDTNPAVFTGNTETPLTCADSVDNGCDDDANQDPVANAGSDIVVTAYSNCVNLGYSGYSCPSCAFSDVNLDGSGSSDVETTALLFSWTESSSYVSLSSATTAAPALSCAAISTPNQPGISTDRSATVTLSVTDCDDSSASDTVNVTCRCITQ
jgi:hypothetical protein